MQIEIVDIITPKNYQLRGVWVGAQKPKKVFIFIHGLTSDLFSGKTTFGLASDDSAVLSFNNRGYGIISKIKQLNRDNPKGYDSIVAGTAHEIFEDCVDDLEGAVQLCHDRGVKEVYLVGHSTGCQKSIFYLSKTKNKQNVTGVVLLCPLSDYAAVPLAADKTQFEKALKYARKEVDENRPHALLSEEYWPSELIDAQRFISLYTPESSEEIFTYSHNKEPKAFQSVESPMLVVLAGADEYCDRPTEKLKAWFDRSNVSSKYKSVVIEKALHNLKGSEKDVCMEIEQWVSK